MSNAIYSRAEKFFGRGSQVIVLAEECAELAAVSARVANGKADIHDAAFIEELADVSIMIEQAKRWLNDGELEEAMTRKLEKLSKRLDALGAPTTSDVEMHGFGT